MIARSLLVLAATVASSGLVLAGCVILSDEFAGQSCTNTSVCGGDLVCVLLDEDRPQSGAVCMPMSAVDAPVACASAEECAAQGFPVDATCEEGLCACRAPSLACPGTSERRDPDTCLCVFDPSACLVDAGPLPDDAGPAPADAGPPGDAGPCG